MTYESFNNSTQKIRKSWERSDENENNLKDIPLATVDFNSINFNKRIVTIPIVTDELVPFGNPEKVDTILLENFPEWSLNMIEVTCIYTMSDGFASFPIFDGNGIIQDGDIRILQQDFEYWFNNVDATNFNLKIFRAVRLRQFNKGSTDINVPLFLTLSLKILNQRIYETMNEKKE